MEFARNRCASVRLMTPAGPDRPAGVFLCLPFGLGTLIGGRTPMESNVWLVASAWMALALVASLISIRVGISVALIEILIGILAGNFLGIHTTPWIDFLATFGSGLLTFLAGAEIDPDSLRRHLKPAAAIGGVSFLAPFLGAAAFA
jgi:Kef-type K+ transport system membrane component KefB